MTRAYVGVGANVGDVEETIRAAVARLAGDPDLRVVGVSALRETEPLGYTDQPRFVNGAVALETELSPRELLTRLLAVECELGRTREGPRFGPRTIDLDLLLYGEQELEQPGLRLPHPRLHERRFALEPVAELDPEARVPGRGTVSTLLAELD